MTGYSPAETAGQTPTVDRAELRALRAAATQGVAEVRVVSGNVMVWAERNGYGLAVCDCGAEELPQAWADARFIAAVVNHLGALLDQLDDADEVLRRIAHRDDATLDELRAARAAMPGHDFSLPNPAAAVIAAAGRQRLAGGS